MEKEKHMNYFIIEKLKLKEEPDYLTNIYDLSILNNIKEKKPYTRNKVKKYFQNIVKTDNTKKINLEKKTQILKVVKKVILSSNTIRKPNYITLKKICLFAQLFYFILAITLKSRIDKENIILNLLINDKNIPFNVSKNYTNTTNITNDDGILSYIFNNTFFDFLINNTKFNNIYNFAKNIKEMIIILVWLFYLYKIIPNWDKINDALYKITSYLVSCESNENNNYFYYLLKDFSILVTKKQYYYKNKNLLSILPPKNGYLPNNNIFLYCINIINNFIGLKSITIKNHKLISNEDYNDIKVLTLFIEKIFKEELKIYIYKIMKPLIISFIINIIIYNPEYELILYFLMFILIIVSEFIFLEFIQANELIIDEFIDIYNDSLIKKNRFIYRKNKLIMYFALKNNNYTKKQIIKLIERIIDY